MPASTESNRTMGVVRGRVARFAWWWLVIPALPAPAGAAEEIGARAPFALGDYFKLRRITELALSPSGSECACILEQQSLALDRKERSLWLLDRGPNGDYSARLLEGDTDVRELAWRRGDQELACLTSHGEKRPAQVWSCAIATGTWRALTALPESVTAYEISGDGRRLACLTRKYVGGSESLYDQLNHSKTGIVIDKESTTIYDFIAPSTPRDRRIETTLAVGDWGSGQLRTVLPGELITEFHWAPDGERLSIVLSRAKGAQLTGTALTLFDCRTGEFAGVPAPSASPEDGLEPQWEGGEWSPGGNQILVRTKATADPWLDRFYPRLRIYDTKRGEWSSRSWMLSTYKPRFRWRDENTIWIDDLRNAAGGLFSLDLNSASGQLDPVLPNRGSVTQVCLNRDGTSAVYVAENFVTAPEVWREDFRSHDRRRISTFNASLGQPTWQARPVEWKSDDGFPLHGWLLRPAATETPKLPLLTFVHGGPAAAYPESFAGWAADIWPYPFELLAARGFAIFIPNYRGTASFGRAYQRPTAEDAEPVTDIVSGVRFLLAHEGIDPEALGIMGHSHGAWLGPLVAARNHLFRAGSFAEDVGNLFTQYEHTSGRLNREVHDRYYGGSPYQDPQLYLRLSPIFQLDGFPTACLFEYGAQASAISGLGYLASLWHAGIPVEYIVYPHAAHNLTTPSMQRESMMRNLDWFRFWLKGEEDPDLDKADEYARWRKLRDRREIGRQKAQSSMPATISK